jgi:hypothetical protein
MIATEHCTEHPNTAGAERHDCYPSGAVLTLWPARWTGTGKNLVHRQTLWTVDHDGNERATVSAPDVARAEYAALKERLDDEAA